MVAKKAFARKKLLKDLDKLSKKDRQVKSSSQKSESINVEKKFQ